LHRRLVKYFQRFLKEVNAHTVSENCPQNLNLDEALLPY